MYTQGHGLSFFLTQKETTSWTMAGHLVVFVFLLIHTVTAYHHGVHKSVVAGPCISPVVDLSIASQQGSLRSLSTRLDMAGMPYVPFYPDKSKKDYMWLDIYNALGRTRTLFVGRFMDDEAANQLIASLIWLESQSNKDPITLYFNVPGCIIKPSFAVYDTMRRMTCPLRTINAGLTVGMGALLCAVGTPGERYALPNSRFLVGRTGLEDGFQGQATDMAHMVRDVMKDNTKFSSELARLTGTPLEKVNEDIKRDFYLTAAEAAAYGVVDKVMVPQQPVKMMRYRGSDDDVVTFGHFSEVRKVKSGPADVVKQWNAAEFDEYTANEMQKQGYTKGRSDRVDPRSLRNGGGGNRFANSRCRPPSKKPPPVKTPGSDDDEPDNPFKNTGW